MDFHKQLLQQSLKALPGFFWKAPLGNHRSITDSTGPQNKKPGRPIPGQPLKEIIREHEGKRGIGKKIQQVQSTKLNTTQPSRQSQSTKNCLVAALMHPLEGPSRQKTEKSVFRRLGTSKGPVDKKRKNRFFVDWETPKAQWYNQPLPSIARWAGCWYFCVRVHLA